MARKVSSKCSVGLHFKKLNYILSKFYLMKKYFFSLKQCFDRRNESIIGQSSSADKKQVADNGADKFGATMTEYSKAKV